MATMPRRGKASDDHKRVMVEHYQLAEARGLSYAISTSRVHPTNRERWAVKDYYANLKSGALVVGEPHTGAIVKVYPAGQWFGLALELPGSHDDWEEWTPLISPEDERYLQPEDDQPADPQTPAEASAPEPNATPRQQSETVKGPDDREWHYCLDMSESGKCSNPEHLDHKRHMHTGKGWWDYTVEAPKASEVCTCPNDGDVTPAMRTETGQHLVNCPLSTRSRAVTPGFDGPEGTEWPGGKAQSVSMMMTDPAQVRMDDIAEQRAVIRNHGRERY